tara:strand:+ start:245 stop:487 length:243 start_codon:yes stop_codon:yes gene_type:complete
MSRTELSLYDSMLYELEGYGYDLIDEYFDKERHYPIIIIEGEYTATQENLDEVMSIINQFTTAEVKYAGYGAIECHLYHL